MALMQSAKDVWLASLKPFVRRHVPLRVRNTVRELPTLPKDTWTDIRLASLVEDVRPYTMVSEDSLLSLAAQVTACLAENVPGDFVECGTWRGGASFLMAKLLDNAKAYDRQVWMFDSFEGLPPPTDVDGDKAEQYSRGETDRYFDNCSASIEDVQGTIAKLNIKRAIPVKGWFNETLPRYGPTIGQIALLRLDGDWYESIKICLDELYRFVAPGGYIVFDDYTYWDGCAMAVHEFLAVTRPPLRLNFDGQFYVRKPQLDRRG
jgi:O-methyltransferase